MRSETNLWLSCSALAMGLGCGGACAQSTELAPREQSSSEQNQRPVDSLYDPELGKGVDHGETKTFGTCVVFPRPSLRKNSLEGRLYDEFSITSRSELDDKLKVSAKAAAKRFWGSASGQMANFRHVDIKADAFYWVVNATYELAYESIESHDSSLSLTPQAQTLLQEHGWHAFRKACGQRFYVGRKIGAQYALLYEFSSLKNKLSSALSASAAMGAFGIEAEGDFCTALVAGKEQKLLVIHADGSGDEHALADDAGSPKVLKEALVSLRQSLGEDLKGVALEWESLDYNVFPEIVAAQNEEEEPVIDSIAVDEALEQMYARYQSNKTLSVSLEKMHNESAGDSPLYMYRPEDRLLIERQGLALVAQNEEISRMARSCLMFASSASCTLDTIPKLDIVFPSPEKDFTGLGTWSVQLLPSFPHADLPFVDILIYSHRGDTRPRRFKTNYLLQEFPGTIAAFAGVGRNLSFIGDNSVHEPAQGVRQINVCRGEYSSVCDLRIIELPDVESDGGVRMKLELALYDENGIETQRHTFHSQDNNGVLGDSKLRTGPSCLFSGCYGSW